MDLTFDEVADELREAFERAQPEGPFLGSAAGVEIEVSLDGNLMSLGFDEPTYRVTGSAELGVAVVAAYRTARESAFGAQRQMAADVLADLGVADPERWPA